MNRRITISIVVSIIILLTIPSIAFPKERDKTNKGVMITAPAEPKDALINELINLCKFSDNRHGDKWEQRVKYNNCIFTVLQGPDEYEPIVFKVQIAELDETKFELKDSLISGTIIFSLRNRRAIKNTNAPKFSDNYLLLRTNNPERVAEIFKTIIPLCRGNEWKYPRVGSWSEKVDKE